MGRRNNHAFPIEGPLEYSHMELQRYVTIEYRTRKGGPRIIDRVPYRKDGDYSDLGEVLNVWSPSRSDD